MSDEIQPVSKMVVETDGTQRVFEALQKFPQAEIIVNLQGDEPLMPVQVIDRVIKLVLSLKKKKIPEIIVTAATKFKSVSQKEAKSNVKVVFNHLPVFDLT